MSASRENIRKKVAESLVVPSSLPLEMSKEEYRESRTDEVIRLVHNGYSFEKAFYTATGQKYQQKKKIHKSPLAVSAACIAATVAASSLAIASSFPDNSQIASSDETMSDVSAATTEKTVLIAGMDTRPEVNKGDGSAQDVPGNRTDALAVAKISPVSNTVVSVVSIPRDTAVDTTSCSGGDAAVVKVNSIYDDYGMDCLKNVAQDITGEDIDASVAFNFDSFMTVVDSLGGIDISTDGPVIDDTLGVIIPHAGTHHVDGRTALNYARARKVEGTSKSDLNRVQGQQQVMLSLLESMKNSARIQKVSAARDIISHVLPDARIEGISTTEFIPLLKLAMSLSSEDVVFSTLPIIGEDGMGNLVYDEESAHNIFDTMRYSTTPQPSHTT